MGFGFFIAWMIWGLICAAVAPGRGRSGFAWFVIGFLTGPFGLLALFIVEKKMPSTHIQCPDCRESILKEAKVCKHCGKRFDGSTAGAAITAAAATASAPVAVDRHCPKCGGSVSATAQVCLGCGEEL